MVARRTAANGRTTVDLISHDIRERIMSGALVAGQRVTQREIQETFPEKNRPMYSTVQTVVYRLEVKKAVKRVKKIGNAHIFEAVISRDAARGRLIEDLLSLFGGKAQPVMTHLVESGKLTLDDVQEAEKTLRRLARKDKPS